MDALDVSVEVAFSVVGLAAAIKRTVKHRLGDGLRRHDTVSHLEVSGQPPCWSRRQQGSACKWEGE